MYQLVCERISALSSTEQIPAHRTILARYWDSVPMGVPQPPSHALPSPTSPCLCTPAAQNSRVLLSPLGNVTRSFSLLSNSTTGSRGLGSSAFPTEAVPPCLHGHRPGFKHIIAESWDLVILWRVTAFATSFFSLPFIFVLSSPSRLDIRWAICSRK